jgi:hypothetical protein
VTTPRHKHDRGPTIAAVADPVDVAGLARRLLDAVECGDVVADDAAGRRMVALWQVLAGEASAAAAG